MGKFEIVWSTEDFSFDAREMGHDEMFREMFDEVIRRVYEDYFNGKEEFYYHLDKHDDLYPLRQSWFSFTDEDGSKFGSFYVAIVVDGDKWVASVEVG